MTETQTLRERWQPTRGGLVNLFKYEDQVFRYENGHLLLRGNNGSGKSRVLALQLPFLFDGEIAPSRVEPDGDFHKRMEWNLLMDQHERRTGYTWIEFGRRDDDGGEQYLTLGCGLEARRGGGAPKRWFFITKKRIGHDLSLLTDNRVPLSRKLLSALMEESGEGQMFAKAREYRVAVDDALFKLGSRYGPLIDLLIQLRQPQLMRDMKEDLLSDALSEALPPVSDMLIDQVAESFHGLDSDRKRTEAQREMLETVEAFHEGYREYLRVAVRRLCRVVRGGQSQFMQAARKLRELDEGLGENRQRLSVETVEVENLATKLAALEAEIATLRDSPEMRSKRELDQAQTLADERAADAETAKADLDKAIADSERADAEREQLAGESAEAEAKLQDDHRQLAESYRELISAVDGGFFALAENDPDAEEAKVTKQIAGRRKAVRHLESCNEEISARRKRYQAEREHSDRCEQQVSSATEKVRETEKRFVVEIEQFGEAVAHWERDLVEIDAETFPRGQSWSAQLAGWVDRREGEFSFSSALREARDATQQHLQSQRAGLSLQQDEAELSLGEVQATLFDLRAGKQIEPPPRYTRGERDAARDGAPFWKCFDFRDGVPLGERAGWEAALESAGLLDAWLLPDGSFDSDVRDDDLIATGDDPELAVEHSLAALLRPNDSNEAHHSLLRRIGNHQGSARCWVDRDGHWGNGPHGGHWHKQDAQFLGHRAREENRRQRIAELQAEAESLAEKLDEISAALDEVARRESALALEAQSAPTTRLAEEVALTLELERESLNAAKLRLVEAEKLLAAAASELAKSVSKRDADAADMRLDDWAKPDQLKEFGEILAEFDLACTRFWPDWRHCKRLAATLLTATNRQTDAAEAQQLQRQRYSDRLNLASRARSAADALLATVGASVGEVLERLGSAESRAKTTGRELEAKRKSVHDLEIERARLDAKREDAVEQRESAEEGRNHAVGRMELFVAEELFLEIDPEFQPDRATFSPSAAVDLARHLEQELKQHLDDDERWNQLQSAIASSFNELSDQLGRHGLMPQLRNIDEASVSVIRCDFQGQSRGVRELADVFDAELEHHARIFEEREREIIENHLIGEAAMQLQILIRNGENWVVGVNEELQRVPTSSGIQLKFQWDVDTSEDDRLKPVRRLFLKTSAALTPAERETIGNFLHERIRNEREQDDTLPWRQHLERALDYRSWHRFGILRRTGGSQEWKKLTKRVFGTGSGGEKALTLTVPQFAAAAAHYRSAHPHAPRLILLDEVFVGIDQATRARLMGLLETFDLDYVMTSESEWGTHPTVSALAIYQLATRQGFNAVAVTRWIWNGSEKIRDTSDDE